MKNELNNHFFIINFAQKPKNRRLPHKRLKENGLEKNRHLSNRSTVRLHKPQKSYVYLPMSRHNAERQKTRKTQCLCGLDC